MRIISLKSNKQQEIIKHSIRELKNGGLVVSPSDTVYGLLVDATNEKAVSKLIEFKQRPPGKPISVFISDFGMMKKYAFVDRKQSNILKQLLPGPFTVILNARRRSVETSSAYTKVSADKHDLSQRLLSEKKTLGIRIPINRFIIELVNRFGKPMTATSANLSGRSSHYSIETLLRELPESKKALIDVVIDAGKLPHNKPSTIVDLTNSRIKIIRQGDVVFKEFQSYISDSPSQTKKLAQFILQKVLNRHAYSLHKPIIFILQGELGVGKTVFVKGSSEYLGIKDIISPTYVVYYEYTVSLYPPTGLAGRYIDTFIHMDLYNIQDPEEFKYLHLERYLRKNVVMCIEWGEKAGEIMEILKSKGNIVYVKMRYKDEKTREIAIRY